jgi:hypothetical protein
VYSVVEVPAIKEDPVGRRVSGSRVGNSMFVVLHITERASAHHVAAQFPLLYRLRARPEKSDLMPRQLSRAFRECLARLLYPNCSEL